MAHLVRNVMQPCRFEVQEVYCTGHEKSLRFATFAESLAYTRGLQDANHVVSQRCQGEYWTPRGTYAVDITASGCVSSQALIVPLDPVECGLLTAVIQNRYAEDDGPARIYLDWLKEHDLEAPAFLPGRVKEHFAQALRAPAVLQREPVGADGYVRVWFTDGRQNLFLWLLTPGAAGDPYVLLETGSAREDFPRGGHVRRDRDSFSPQALQILGDLGLGT
jgi:hypothetical protein